MKNKRVQLQVVITAVALLLLGGLGAYWPAIAGADSPISTGSPVATIGDAITYQGYLTDPNGAPLSGTFTMRFQIFNDQSAGALLWDGGDLSVEAQKGLFAVRLAITTDIFNGEELWVEQTVEGEVLAPRQEIVPAPMAHTLRPGAIIKGTANAIPNNYLLDVQMNNDTFAFNRGAIFGQSTTGNAVMGLAKSGRAIYGQTEDGFAIYGFDGGSSPNQGYAGFFYSTNGIGVYGYSNGDRSHPNILAPGVYGHSNRGVGVYGRGDTSDSSSFYNEGGYFEGGKGLYARGTDSAGQQGYGARIFSDNYRGMYVAGQSNHYDAYFGGNGGISAKSYTDRAAATQSLVINLGSIDIQPGDLVAIVGVTESAEGEGPMLAVAKVDATNRNGVIGVAKEAISAQKIVFEEGGEAVDFAPVSGPIPPNSYLVIITAGLAPTVNVASLALAIDWQIGDKLALSTSGELVRSSRDRDGTGDGTADGIVLGRVAGPMDATQGTLPLFINID
ncbi:MAG: hypothetical protein WBO46_13195 [Caldilineaceae bacterium]